MIDQVYETFHGSWPSVIDKASSNSQSSWASSLHRPTQVLSSLTNVSEQCNMKRTIPNECHDHTNRYKPRTRVTKSRRWADAPPSIPSCSRLSQRQSDTRILTDFNQQIEAELGTPSSASSTSSYLIRTPISAWGSPSDVTIMSCESEDVEMDMGACYGGIEGLSEKHGYSEWDTSMCAEPSESSQRFMAFDEPGFECEGFWSDSDASNAMAHPDDIPDFHNYVPELQSSPSAYPTISYCNNSLSNSLRDISLSPQSVPISSGLANSQTAFSPSQFLLKPPKDRSKELTIHQPQPIRPIPIIPLSDLSSAAITASTQQSQKPTAAVRVHENSQPLVEPSRHTAPHPREPGRRTHAHAKPSLSHLALLFQPVSNAVLHQFSAGADAAGSDVSIAASSPSAVPYADTGTLYGATPWCSCGCMGSTYQY